ncbi:MAG: hypothetical protein J0H67_03630 [Rhodospirillales bacterium]|nr:hypothetical protein [Rhodospirillales bacterium]MBN8897578.1 hypothetical protein [Rhodospirillales bacterium]MBN8905879.1 hypothetical protein [Rhodospirillales bacterium]
MATAPAHVLKPSTARVVTIDSFIPVPRGSQAAAPPLLNWPAKDPNDVLDYQVEYAPAVIGNDADGIATLDVTVSPNAPGDLLVTRTTVDGTRAVLWMSAGQSGVVYVVTLAMTTMNGRVVQRSVLLPVVSLSSITVSPLALLTSDGVMITDHNGNPLLSV